MNGILRQFCTPTRLLLILAIGFFISFQLPRVTEKGRGHFRNYKQGFGDFQYTVNDVQSRIEKRVSGEDPERFIFHKHNPGFFTVPPYLFAKFAPPLFSYYLYFIIVIGCCSIVFHYLWLRALFDEKVALYGLLFLLTCPFFLYFSATFFSEPWDFFFFPLALLLYQKHLQLGRRKYFYAAWAAYFMVCSSYYMYVVSGWLMLMATHYLLKGRIQWRHAVIFGLAPISAILLVGIELMAREGGLIPAFTHIVEVAVWRSAGTELGEGRVTDFAYLWQNFRGWLHITMYRLETYYFYSLEVWLAVGLCAFLLPQRYPMRARLGFFCLMLIAGLSWTYLMRQHTSIHDFTGGYSYFAWMICFGLFFGTCHRILKTSANALEQRLKPLVIVVAVAWVMPNLNKFILVDWLDLWARLFS